MLFSVLLVQVLVFTHFISTLLMTIDLIVIVAILKLGYLVKTYCDFDVVKSVSRCR